MGQLVRIDRSGWCCITFGSRLLHYYNEDQDGMDFPTSICARFCTDADVYTATEEELATQKKCKWCSKKLIERNEAVEL